MGLVTDAKKGSAGVARTVIVLAAGEGKRMKSALPKVLHPLLGRTLLGHVLAAAEPLGADHTVVVVGRGAERVAAHVAEIAPAARTVLQAEQRGTGHAARIAMNAALDATGSVVILSGDAPLQRVGTLREMVAAHERSGSAATVLTAEVPDPAGLGRIVRGAGGGLEAIVEHRDATDAQRAIREINAGVYVFDAQRLRDALGKLSTDNDQGEEYLTDAVGHLVASGEQVLGHRVADHTETLGCNDRVQLAELRALLRDRVNETWMRDGVTILDPATTWVDVTVSLAPDVVLHPNTHLQGATVVDEAAQVGPDTTLVDSRVGAGAVVVKAHVVSSEIGPECQVGPYAYLRPGNALARKAKVGTFVEVKNSQVGEGSKIPHLSYVGDATIGEHSNIGAANVTVNYDGVRKHRTTIGDHVRTGSDTMLVAPVEIGDGAYTAAGSVITKDVPPGALGVARGQQRNIEGWVERRRGGTPAAEAAARAHRRDQEHSEMHDQAGGGEDS